jgi:outer membrane immunogenic protein
MSRVTFACAAMIALVGAAAAADLPPRYSPPPPAMAPSPFAPQVQNWTGLYIGINGGWGWGRSDWTTPLVTTGDFDLSGGLVGGTLGYNWQTANWVYGLEGDIDWSDINGSTNVASAFCAAGCRTSNSWLSTVRGRVGYAFDRFLPYITGGLAIGDVRADIAGVKVASDTNVGWTFGGGIEYAALGNWTVKAEYLYVDLGDFNCGVSCGLATTDKVSFRSNIFRGGINYRF